MPTVTLFTILLLALLSATAVNAISFIKLSRRLTRLREPQKCQFRNIELLELFQRQLRIARTCLPFDQRVKLQTLCRRKPETTKTKEACDKLAACPRIRPIKKAIRQVLMATCPKPAPRFSRVERRWRRRLNRLIRNAGLPDPIYDTIVLEPTRKKVTSAVVLLHGLGDSAKNRLPMAEDIQKVLPNTRIILPQSPEQFNNFTNDVRNSWFNNPALGSGDPEAKDEVVAAAAAIDAIAEVQRAVYGLSRDKIAILGVSQGGAIALTTYLRHEWGAAIGVTTFLPIADSYPAELANGSVGVELLMLHGRADMVIPFSVGVLSRDFIRALGRKVRFVELEGNHFFPFEQEIVTDEIAAQLKSAFS